jgi:hypothetical protein
VDSNQQPELAIFARSITISQLAITGQVMKFLAAIVFLLSPSAVLAYEAISKLVECSTISTAPNVTLKACATWYLSGPSTATIDGVAIEIGGYKNEYTIVTGLKEGIDTSALSEAAAKKAFSNGIVVLVERDDDDKCKVTVNVKGKSTVCSSCTFCGNDRYTADCQALKNGRKVTCESTGEGQVFFPLSKSALVQSFMKSPIRAPVNAPTKVAVRAPVKTPASAPKK